ncbi:MAG TPA: hypothetical protein VK054_11680 [Beutenbergiaceae bacterium]|nr:hypothetical protein [Beutenbergiaceae bacterium]
MTRNLDLFLAVPDVAADTADPLDRHYTPEWMTEALLEALGPYALRDATILEPCAGEGHIARVLERHGHHVTCHDINPEVCGAHRDRYIHERDFLTYNPHPPDCWDWIITNPPYGDGLPAIFLRRAIAMAQKGVAFLVWSSFLEGCDDRIDLLRSRDLRQIIHLPRGNFITPGKRHTGPSKWPVWLIYRPGLPWPHFGRIETVWVGKEARP